MEPGAVATVVAATVAAIAALLSARYARRSGESARLADADVIANKFREPLLQAAFNLQTRLYNIARLEFLQRFRAPGSRAEDLSYSIDNTLYLLGQYFCWVEILRRESQFLDPRSSERERAVADQLERVRNAFASSETPDPHLRIFRGQQRAIGEVLLDPIPPPGSSGSPRWDCLGYAAFVERLGTARLTRWLRPVREDLEAIAQLPTAGRDRIVEVQHELLTLVDMLDPSAHRTSGRLRERL